MLPDLTEPLTTRELEVLDLLARRFSNKEIAETLSVSWQTVAKHTNNIYQKLRVAGRRDAVERAEALGITSAPPLAPRAPSRLLRYPRLLAVPTLDSAAERGRGYVAAVPPAHAEDTQLLGMLDLLVPATVAASVSQVPFWRGRFKAALIVNLRPPVPAQPRIL